jgi:predicted phage baseplate assembly protein
MARGCDCFDDPGAACAAEDVSPDLHENRPGLPALAYRYGTWSSTRRRLVARLENPLQGSVSAGDARELNITATDDPAVALLDAFSVVADVLSFYEERIANEGFLRTATERRSVGYLASSIGYRLSPGVAAGVDLVFSVDESDKAPGFAAVPAGTQVLHIPGQDELPQPFETSAALDARASWNKLAVPTLRAPVLVDDGTAGAPDAAETLGRLDLLGVATGLRQHSRLLIVYTPSDAGDTLPYWRLHRLASVTPDSKRGVTRVTWDLEQSVGPLPPRARLRKIEPAVYALRTTTALFGWNAPDWHTLPEAIQKAYLADGETDSADWPLFDVPPSVAGTVPAHRPARPEDGRFVTNQTPVIDLAQEHPEIEPKSMLVILDVSGTRGEADGSPLARLYRVKTAARTFRQNFRITGQSTRVVPFDPAGIELFGLRESAVYAASELLRVAPVDDPSSVGPNTIEVVGEVALPEGRRVLVSGWPEGADTAGAKTVESAVVRACDYQAATDRTVLDFAPDDRLSQAFQRADTFVYANVVAATHGKTINEVLGSGDGSVPFPRFTLKQQPLTHVSDPTSPAGARSTLGLRVNGIAWTEVGSLLDADHRAHVYTTSIDDDAAATIVFGDGRTGSRLPSGAENVSATYRIGIGKVGEVAAESIALMVKKPLGMKAVVNLEPSSGGEDPETSATARAQAPASVLVLGRVVSVSDYADFARSFPGVGKAAVTVLWDGDRQVAYLTVTDNSGNAFDAEAEVFENLRAALLLSGDAEVALVVATLDAQLGGAAGPRTFGVTAGVLVDAAYVREDVIAQAHVLLAARFGAGARDLGQHVSAAEVIQVLHEVDGVIAVDLDELYLVDADEEAGVEGPAGVAAPRGTRRLMRNGAVNRLDSCVPALPGRVELVGGARVLRPAELLIIDPARVSLLEMVP